MVRKLFHIIFRILRQGLNQDNMSQCCLSKPFTPKQIWKGLSYICSNQEHDQRNDSLWVNAITVSLHK